MFQQAKTQLTVRDHHGSGPGANAPGRHDWSPYVKLSAEVTQDVPGNQCLRKSWRRQKTVPVVTAGRCLIAGWQFCPACGAFSVADLRAAWQSSTLPSSATFCERYYAY
jgi:hypothetical protein